MRLGSANSYGRLYTVQGSNIVVTCKYSLRSIYIPAALFIVAQHYSAMADSESFHSEMQQPFF